MNNKPELMLCSQTFIEAFQRVIYESEYAKHWLNNWMKGSIMAKGTKKGGKGTKKGC